MSQILENGDVNSALKANNVYLSALMFPLTKNGMGKILNTVKNGKLLHTLGNISRSIAKARSIQKQSEYLLGQMDKLTTNTELSGSQTMSIGRLAVPALRYISGNS